MMKSGIKGLPMGGDPFTCCLPHLMVPSPGLLEEGTRLKADLQTDFFAEASPCL